MRVYTFKDLTHELRVTMEHELTTDNQDGDKSFHGLIEIIQFAENVTAKIHGLHDESEIFRVVIEEFDKSDHYIATILLTTDDGSSLKLLQTSLSSHNLTAMEKAAGVFRDSYRIDLNKSNIFSQVVLEGKTIVANGPEILGELFPRPLATGLVKLMGLGSQPSVLTPLYLHGNTIGVLSLSTPEHVEYFAASARNLAQHISIALELANEHTERKQIEQWFKESEEKYNTLLSTTGIPITYFNLNGHILLTNVTTAQNFNLTPDDLVGKSLYELFPDNADEIMEAIRKIAETGEGFEYESSLELPWGTRWYWTNLQPMVDTQGDIVCIQAISHDITDRRQAEKALKESEDKFRNIFEHANDEIIYLNPTGTILDVNGRVEDIFGYKREEIIGKNFTELNFIISEGMEKLINEFISAVDGEAIPLTEIAAEHKDGSKVFVELSVRLVQFDGQAQGLLVIVRDVTQRKEAEEETKRLNAQLIETNMILEEEISERKRAEEALTDSEEKLRLTFDAIGDGVIVSDLQGNIVEANQTFFRMFGHTEKEKVIGRNAAEFIAEKDHPKLKDHLEEQLASDICNTREYTLVDELGREFASEIKTAVVRDSLGNPVRFIAVKRDITERKRAEAALRDSEERFRSIIENAEDAITLVDATGTILYASPSIERIAGYKPDDLVGTSINEYAHPDNMSIMLTNFAMIISTPGAAESISMRLRRKDSSWYWVEGVGKNFLEDPKVQAIVCNYRDVTERKQAEEAIRRSEEKYRLVTENVNELITLIDMEGRYVYANEAHKWIVGYDPEELIGKNAFEFLHPEDSERVMNELTKNNGQREADLEVRYRCADGSYKWIQSSSSILTDETGTPQHGLMVGSDTTEHKKAEEALRHSEAHWRALVENAPNIITSVDSDGVIWSINRILPGLTEEEVIGSKVWDFIDPEFHNIVSHTFEQVLQTGKHGSFEVKGVGPDGSVAWYETQLGPVEQDENVVALTLITTDITDRKNSEKEILQRNRELAALNEIAQTISQSLDLDEILNNAFDKMMGILNIQHGSVHVVDKETNQLVMKIYRGTMEDDMKDFQSIDIGKGRIGSVALSGEPLFVASLDESDELLLQRAPEAISNHGIGSAMFVPLKAKGYVLGVTAAYTETGRKFTADERELMTTIGHQIGTAIKNAQLLEEASRAEALEELDSLRTALLASVSHELRTPLTSIKGLASTLIQPDVEWDDETQQDFLKIIDRETDILTHIVEDLMQMSQIEAGIMNMEKTKSSISSIVHQLSDKLKDLTELHIFKVEIPPRTSSIYADEIRIGEVITNLVANAAAYSEADTPITLRAYESDGHLIVTVIDQGIGIPPEHIDKVFDRFYRLESGIARRRGGTGLGLAICKGIIESHDGDIWVTSVPGKGSTFSFSLPIANGSDMIER